MGTLDSREYQQLVRRKFRPYSRGHQMMYLKPITQLSGNRHRILEAGFGIGFGLDRMVTAGIIGDRYVGCEPNTDSFLYVQSRHSRTPNIELVPSGFLDMDVDGEFDHAFCIEVIEHVPMDQHLEFLTKLRDAAPMVWFSTPDKDRVPREGVRTKDEWVDLLHSAGFSRVFVDTSHWTYLYECER